jgi:hypothetical protein
VVLFGESFRDERVANGAGKRNVDNAAVVHMPDFRSSETKLTGRKLMWMDGDLRPETVFRA